MYEGDVVKPDECIKFSSLNKAVIYNKYTMECLEINTIIPGCLTYSEDLTTCLKCEDDKIILENDCIIC